MGERLIAPGADQFLPPARPGPWLPPERTFSTLSADSGLVPARMRHRAVGVSHAIGGRDERTAAIEWFMQSTVNQIATLFGVDESSALGHYYVARVGDVDVSGWRTRFRGTLSRHVKGQVEYAAAAARWTPDRDAPALQRVSAAVARRGVDRVHDLRTSVDVSVPDTDTYVTVGFLFSHVSNDSHTSTAANRFNLELRQQLPFQPLHRGELHLLFSIRTLLHEDDAGSIFDELLTLAPPARVTGGLQVQF
jgi:hypothetical protein